MLARQLEPEFNNDFRESQDYNNMDHVAVNEAFVRDLVASGVLDPGPVDPEADSSVILDLGTGTALIPIELCMQFEACRIIAQDAAVSMLELAKINVAIGLCEHRIELRHGDCKQLEFDADLFDGVMCNSLLHHLADPSRGLSEMLRVCKPGGWIFVRDLFRPESSDQVEQLVATHAALEPPANQQLLRQSLHAALTLDEASIMAVALGLSPECLTVTSDRHWTLCTRKAR